jgi:arylformamidase
MSGAVFLGYDQAALDAQYAHFARVPDAAEILRQQAQASARVLAERSFQQISYGSDPAQVLHLSLSPTPAARLVVFFHGGGWSAMGPTDFAHVVPAFHALGASVALAGFVQRPLASLAEIVAQCRRAVLHAGRLGRAAGLPHGSGLIVAGVSSGAHLAAMCAMPGWAAEAGSDVPPVAGALLLSGMYDLEPVRLSGRNAALGLDARSTVALSPVTDDGSGLAPPPAVISHGADESAEMARQACALATAWRRRNGAARVVAAHGRNHFDLSEDVARPGTALHDAARSLLCHAD